MTQLTLIDPKTIEVASRPRLPEVETAVASSLRQQYETAVTAASASYDTARDKELMFLLRDMCPGEDYVDHVLLPELNGRFHRRRQLHASGGYTEWHDDDSAPFTKKATITVMSHGAGTQTSVLAALAGCRDMVDYVPGGAGDIHIDFAQFSHVGDHGRPNEWPATIYYLHKLRTISHLPIVRVDPHVWNPTLVKQNDARGLFDRFYDRETMPFRSFRGCTDAFKIQPLEGFLAWVIDEAKERYGIDLTIRQVIGYSADEEDRAVKFKANHPSIVPYFPLIEWGWRRADTLTHFRRMAPMVISAIGEPEKSGCWFCPFQAVGGSPQSPQPRSWQALRQQHPDLWYSAQAMEARQNVRRFEQGKKIVYLSGDVALTDLVKKGSGQQGQLLDTGYDDAPGDDTCTSWGCFR